MSLAKDMFNAWTTYDQEVIRMMGYTAPKRIAQCLTPSNKDIRILELGSGTGLLTQELRRTFPKAHITAADFSLEMMDRAQKKRPFADTYVEVDILSEKKQWPADLKDFDLIAASGLMEFAPEIDLVLCRAKKRLKSGGVLISTFPLQPSAWLTPPFPRNDWMGQISDQIEKNLRYADPIAYYSDPRTIVSAFDKARLSIIAMSDIFHGFSADFYDVPYIIVKSTVHDPKLRGIELL